MSQSTRLRSFESGVASYAAGVAGGVVAFVLSMGTLLAPAPAADGPTFFRADQGLAADDKAPLPDDFSDPKALVWRQPLAPGHSSPAVHGDSIYVTTFESGKLATVALDRKTGAERWKQVAPASRVETFHPTSSAAAATVACDGQRVYSFFGSYGLLCYDLAGKLVWEKQLGPFQDEFGSASSPVLVDGKLLLNEDHDKDSFLLCLDAATGKTVWQTPREGFTRSYATPIIMTVGKRKQVVVAGALQLVAYDFENGKQLWSVDGFARIVNTTPVVADGLLFVSTWSPGGDTDARISMEPWETALKLWDKNKDGKLVREEVDNKDVLDRFFRIDLDQDKALDQNEWTKYARVFELARNTLQAIKLTDDAPTSPELVWQYDKSLPYVPSPLAYRGVLYLVKDGGIVTSFDTTSGKVGRQARARGPGNYYASPVAGDGKILLVSERGVITVVRADRQWDVVSSHDLGERTVATPALADGRVYLRTEKALYCFQKKP